jgi:hypothetical protein
VGVILEVTANDDVSGVLDPIAGKASVEVDLECVFGPQTRLRAKKETAPGQRLQGPTRDLDKP